MFGSDWKLEPLRWVRASARLAAVPVHAIQMSWSELAVRTAFDVCVGADIAYDAQTEPVLVGALTGLVRPGGVAWLADPVNTYRATISAKLEAVGFAVRSTSRREEEEGRAVWVRLIEARRRP